MRLRLIFSKEGRCRPPEEPRSFLDKLRMAARDVTVQRRNEESYRRLYRPIVKGSVLAVFAVCVRDPEGVHEAYGNTINFELPTADL